jgi:hypothetical protein
MARCVISNHHLKDNQGLGLYNLYCSPNTITVITDKIMKFELGGTCIAYGYDEKNSKF